MKKNDLSKSIINTIKKICFGNSINLHEPLFFGKEYDYLKDCITSTYVSSSGNYIGKFEKKLKNYSKSNYVLCTNSGTSALHLAYIVCGLKKNEEILIPSLNYIASSNAALYIGAVPHFIEASEDTLGIDAVKLSNYLKKKLIKKKNYYINKNTGRRVSAIVPTHLYGSIANMNKISNLAKKYKLTLIEDAAEAIGSFHKGRHAGTFGRIGILSFNGNKTITTGSGGALLIKNKKDFIKAKLISNIGKEIKNNNVRFKSLGYNYLMSNIQAAIGCAQIDNIKKILNKKKKIHQKYFYEFSKSKSFKIFQNKFKDSYNYWINILLIKNIDHKRRNSIIKKLHSKKIYVRSSWTLISEVSYFKNYPKMNLKISKMLQNEIINLPSSPKYGS